ncbi:SDR family oxidoreductase [Olsenella sp. Marseille-QA0557]|uniref:SDR family oxidoreductase n=1 Tax=Olsenella sp. Marseille-QA0557 TaxID=3378782 RepID=UPI003D12FA5F
MGCNSIAGYRAVVTGAGSGIGRSLALRLVDLGCNVVITGRTKERLDAVCNEASGAGSIQSFPMDVGEPTDVVRLATHLQEMGGVDIIINNAGALVNTSIDETSIDEFDAVMRTNVRGPFLMCKTFLPQLRSSEHGTIINIGSAASHNAYPNQTAYGASKHALLGMSKSLARELAKDDVRVHVLCPGGIATGMLSGVRDDLREQKLMTPEDIADIVEFLLTHRGNAVIDEIDVRRCGKEPWPWC